MKTSILGTIDKTNFKKYINYHLVNHNLPERKVKIVRIGTFNKDMIIFTVKYYEKHKHAHNISNCEFCDAYIDKQGNLIVSYSFSRNRLIYLVNDINYFMRDNKSKLKMSFPDICLKLETVQLSNDINQYVII